MSPSCVKNPYRELTGAACRDKVEMENVDARKAEERKDLSGLGATATPNLADHVLPPSADKQFTL